MLLYQRDLPTAIKHVSFNELSIMFTAMSITPEQRRVFLIGAAAAAAIILTVSAVRLATCSSSSDKPLSKRQLQRLSPEVRTKSPLPS
jgi:hypothetical protein